jgi:hypothetical protein
MTRSTVLRKAQDKGGSWSVVLTPAPAGDGSRFSGHPDLDRLRQSAILPIAMGKLELAALKSAKERSRRRFASQEVRGE